LRNYFILEFKIYRNELKDATEQKGRKDWLLHKAMSSDFNWELTWYVLKAFLNRCHVFHMMEFMKY